MLVRGLALLPALAWAGAPCAADSADKVATEVCAACHNQDGNSVVPLFPKLAGASPVYLAKQLNDVKSGTRKSDVMAPIAAKLTGKQIDGLAAYYGGKRRSQGAASAPQLVEQGRVIYLQGNAERGLPACAGCHLADGRGAPRYPMLASQNADYVLSQLKAFRDGTRTNDPGRLMRTTASRLTEEEMVAVSQYVASMPVPTVP